MNRAVFLDRDGVINRTVLRDGHPYPPPSVDELEILPGVAVAIEALHRASFRIIAVTNQPDVAKGVQSLHVVESINARIQSTLGIDDFKVCYHVDADGCSCRKPKPGMLLEAAAEWSLDLNRSFIVGDRWRDIGAGKAAGCKTILVGAGYDERNSERPDAIANSLHEASDLILSNSLDGDD